MRNLYLSLFFSFHSDETNAVVLQALFAFDHASFKFEHRLIVYTKLGYIVAVDITLTLPL